MVLIFSVNFFPQSSIDVFFLIMLLHSFSLFFSLLFNCFCLFFKWFLRGDYVNLAFRVILFGASLSILYYNFCSLILSSVDMVTLNNCSITFFQKHRRLCRRGVVFLKLLCTIFWKRNIHQVQKSRGNCNYNQCLPA